MIHESEILCFSNGGNAVDVLHGHPSHHLYINDVLGTTTSFDGSGGGGVDVGGSETSLSMRSLLFSISILKEKVQDVESLVNMFLATHHQASHHLHATSHHALVDDHLTSSIAISSMANVIQEIVQTASFMMLSWEQITTLGTTTQQTGNSNNHHNNIIIDNSSSHHHVHVDDKSSHTMQTANNDNDNDNEHVQFSFGEIDKGNNNNEVFLGGDSCNWYQLQQNKNMNHLEWVVVPEEATPEEAAAYDLVEVDAEDLLARYTHYCQVCGRGFKREANLRMHMRAHGEKYNSSLTIGNTLKSVTNDKKNSVNNQPRKYSCPHKGCRWNKYHVNFQPLKSMVCVRNHYRRSHCPKMFMCKRCNTKEFSVLSDLKTHEKHCGNVKWCCSCGATFTKEEKLMNHVALSVGHTPLIYPFVTNSNNR